MAENAENPEVIVRSYRKVKKAVTSTPGKVALTLGGTAAGAFATYYLGFTRGSDHAVGVMTDFADSLREDDDSDDSDDETEETDDSTTDSTEE